jgi:hypothetical protein
MTNANKQIFIIQNEFRIININIQNKTRGWNLKATSGGTATAKDAFNYL